MKSLALAVERSPLAGRQKIPIRRSTTTTRPCHHQRSPGKLLKARGVGDSASRRVLASGSPEAQTTTMPAFDDLSELVKSGKYKGWLLDQFGVLHDGIKPYDHALELVKLLAEKEDTKLVILTNSARRAPHTLNRLERMGFDRDWFAGVATSGDVAHRVLSLAPGQADTKLLPEEHPLWRDINPFLENQKTTEKGSSSSRRRRCLHFTWEKHDLVHGIDLEELGIDVTTDPAMADFVLVHWFDTVAVEGNKELRPVSEDDIEDLLVKCAERNLPMLVANPDIVACKGDKLLKMPGALAVRYEELGVPPAKIHLLGKPSAIVYHWAQESFFSDMAKSSIIAVGDSLEHDIKGACRFEVDSAFITRGIHCDDLHECNVPEDAWNKDELERLCMEHNADPTICSEFFAIE